MALLKDLTATRAAGDGEYEKRQVELKAAYETFTSEPDQQGTTSQAARTSQQSGEILGVRKKAWAAIAGVVAVAIVIAIAASSGNGSSNQVTQTGANELTSLDSGTELEPQSPSPTPEDIDGETGYLNSCWRDEVTSSGDRSQDWVSVAPTDCNDPGAQWIAYREVAPGNQCPEDFIELQNKWQLCIRAL